MQRECLDHGTHDGMTCPLCAEEIANGGSVRSIKTMMSASLEALAKKVEMRIETVKCDQCGVVKGESNHWLQMDVAPFNRSDTFPKWRISVNDEGPAPRPTYNRLDLCGQECFHKKLDTLLFAGKQ